MSKSQIILRYMLDSPISFISFFLGRIPLWALIYLASIGKISILMFFLLSGLVYLSRSYFDVEIFGANPIYSIFTSVFYSIYKPILFVSVVIIIFLGINYFFITQNFFILLISVSAASIFFVGMTFFFRKDYFDALWRIKNAPQVNISSFKAFLLDVLWLITITTPISLSVVGLLIIYFIEFNILLQEFDGIL
ncbi:hypothetical protein LF845_07375 [Deferribacterales bacterium Es71-Z0220]|uniref:hypothetical protein n=1 Tax=Deferrivibrio essentukiensis TaxID=2880922 RepID=UPI001F6029AB|nr:hypothetical protein [Deferrivibrio essentukiensis]MCB4204780.1 hypothetical protein [Deferrivibrio essentukiensis]